MEREYYRQSLSARVCSPARCDNAAMNRDIRSGRGRPRDPHLESRVYDAVIEVYWERGWSGFTLDAVAKRASVGRAALYRRWNSKDELLVDALEERSPLPVPIDLGSVRKDLVELSIQLLNGYRETAGLVSLRVALDARIHPDLLGKMIGTLNRSRLFAVRSIVRRAHERGELPRSVDTTRILELVAGAVLSHIIFSHRQEGEQSDASDREYSESLVDTVLSGWDAGLNEGMH